MSFFSQRQLATKYTFSLMRANKIIQGRGFKAFKKEKVPYLLGHQIETQYQQVRKLYKHLLSFGKNSPVISLWQIVVYLEISSIMQEAEEMLQMT